ncbi:MAG: hypothetical protein Aurels2KO_13310 [Aureliella sp.]
MAGRQQLSFQITTAHEFLAKLHSEHADVESDLTSARHAINAAMTAYHLIEWVWGINVKRDATIKSTLSVDSKNDFRDYCLRACPELETMQCICEGSKHLGTSGKNVESSDLKGGAFSSGFSKGFDISCLKLTMADGTTSYFDVELETVVEFWDKFFKTHL